MTLEKLEVVKILEQKVAILEKQLFIAVNALEDVIIWNEDLEDEWGDPGERAQEAKRQINIIDGF